MPSRCYGYQRFLYAKRDAICLSLYYDTFTYFARRVRDERRRVLLASDATAERRITPRHAALSSGSMQEAPPATTIAAPSRHASRLDYNFFRLCQRFFFFRG